MPRCAFGWLHGPASMSTTRLLTPPGSIRLNDGLDSLPNRPSAEAPSKASRTSSQRSTASLKTTTKHQDPSLGPQPLTPSSRSSHDYVIVFLGQNTREPLHKSASRVEFEK